ncbi:hypothetical protein ACQP2K_23270 [Microbispora siamensis]
MIGLLRSLDVPLPVVAAVLSGAEVTLVTEPPRPAIVVRDLAATPEGIARATSACVARLMVPAPPKPALVGLFPLDYGESIPVAVAVAVALTGTGLPQVPGADPATTPPERLVTHLMIRLEDEE